MRPPLQLALLLVLPLISPHVAAGQWSSPSIAGPVAIPLTIAPDGRGMLDRSARDTVPREIRPTHWKEGALIGGLSLGVGVALLADALCRSSDTGGSCGGATIGGFLLGGVIGGVSGALVGGQFPKGPDT